MVNGRTDAEDMERQYQLASLRDTFAAAALTGLMQFRIDAATPGAYVKSTAAIAANAYDIADSMLRERERTNHDAEPAATATNTPLNKGAACNTAASGTGNTPALGESEREAIEQMLDEVSGKACAESWVPEILRNLLERLK
jgi:hypothetical protein